MSTEVMHSIIGRAVTDAGFRGMLFSDPGQALLGYDLTEAELIALRNLSPDGFDIAAAMLEDRMSMSAFIPDSLERHAK